mmetsp:Transcript_62095/g.147981  ORF Transcript_62095/g.147981 Transcript_62095/m.147981 type:complete len:206 (-) Transcript_62095:161-778(-)
MKVNIGVIGAKDCITAMINGPTNGFALSSEMIARHLKSKFSARSTFALGVPTMSPRRNKPRSANQLINVNASKCHTYFIRGMSVIRSHIATAWTKFTPSKDKVAMTTLPAKGAQDPHRRNGTETSACNARCMERTMRAHSRTRSQRRPKLQTILYCFHLPDTIALIGIFENMAMWSQLFHTCVERMLITFRLRTPGRCKTFTLTS